MNRTGHVIKGNTLDCNKKHLERALRDYDRQLYLKWNPDKNDGNGMWELRRRPNEKTAVPKWELNGQIAFELEYVEQDTVNHVLDLPVLNYAILTRLREMDAWAVKDWVKKFDEASVAARDKAFAENKADLKYAISQYKRAFSDLRDEIKSGRNPADFLAGNW